MGSGTYGSMNTLLAGLCSTRTSEDASELWTRQAASACVGKCSSTCLQDPALFDRTVLENVAYGVSLSGSETDIEMFSPLL